MQTGEGQQATAGTIMGTGAGTVAARSGHGRPRVSARGIAAASRLGRPPRQGCRRAGFAGLLAAMAALGMAAQAGGVAPPTECPQDAPYTATFSVTCTLAMTCTRVARINRASLLSLASPPAAEIAFFASFAASESKPAIFSISAIFSSASPEVW